MKHIQSLLGNGLTSLGKAVQYLINNALNNDTLDDGRFCGAFVDVLFAALTFQIDPSYLYVEFGNINRKQFGQLATFYKGIKYLDGILQVEIEEEYIKRVQKTEEEREEMLVIGKSSFLDVTRILANLSIRNG